MEQYTNRNLSDIIDNEAKEYALYTIENRAIPSLVDSFKPVQRFVMYSALKTATKEFVKVADIGGSVSRYGYNHGEVSAQDACKLLASDWNNNIPFLKGRGNFGSRLVNDSAAARYVYAKVNDNFFDLYKDFDILPEHKDAEIKIPMWYLPTIPTVLLNGIKGIGTGFATNILPYSIKSIKKCCVEHLANKPISEMIPSFPEFKGDVIRDNKSVTMKGIYTKSGYTITITEVPIGFDRETYIKLLDTLEEKDLVISYIDNCDRSGFNIVVKMKRNVEWNDEKIIKTFKLEKSVTENVTVLDEHGKLKMFDRVEDLVGHFVQFKLKQLDLRIEYMRDTILKDIEIAKAKVEWITSNINGEINYRTLNKKQLEVYLGERYNKQLVEPLISMKMYHMSTDEIDKLKLSLTSLEKEYNMWMNQTKRMQFIKDLKG